MKASHLQLSYGANVIYDDCSFQFDLGDKVGVVGVNGAGKTTLFRVLLGQQKLDDGEIEFPGLRLGYLPQEITIPEDNNEQTVWDYVAAGRPVDDLQNKLNAEYEKLANYPDSQAILQRINELQELIDSFDLANFDHDLLRILAKMQLDTLVNHKMRDLSGGQKSKVAFARVLFENAGLLLLDEPTNHLDTSTRQFLINYLRNYTGTVLVISHDQEFLNNITNKTLFVNKVTHKMKVYHGNYQDFRRQRAEEQAAAESRISAQEREIKRLSEFVARARAAKRSNTALIGMGHQREKVLEKRIAALEEREQEYTRVAMRITPVELGNKVPLEVQNLSFAYPGQASLYTGINFSLTRGEKFLICGENGVGKSTLLKLIVGKLQPTSGSIIVNQKTSIAYYAQELEILDEKQSIFENVESRDFTDTELRSMLANFLFEGEDIYKKIAVLSPGEKARVALCKILLQRTNMIILDEPTNHFDPETQKIIGQNLKDYTGTIIMVSHNPAFVEQIGITRMLIIPTQKSDKTKQLAMIKNYSHELLEYYYYLNSDLV